jgi:hypothetical protein
VSKTAHAQITCETAKPVEPIPRTPDELSAFIRRANEGDSSALASLRGVFSLPNALKMLAGDVAHEAQLALIDRIAGKEVIVREALTRQMDLLREGLAEAGKTPIERLLIERIVATWLHLHELERTLHTKAQVAETLVRHYEWCIDRAHRRYLAAIRTLALVRKLAVPVLQVNVARKQINVGQVVGPTEHGAEE